jgi:hypothetical protein
MVLDLLAGKDFRGTNPSIEMLGALINYRDLVQNLGATSLSLRYNKDRDVSIAQIRPDGVYLDGVKIEPTRKGLGSYCNACGESGCPGPSACVDFEGALFDSVVTAYCNCCGAEREVESDASNYACFVCPNGKVTSWHVTIGIV